MKTIFILTFTDFLGTSVTAHSSLKAATKEMQRLYNEKLNKEIGDNDDGVIESWFGKDSAWIDSGRGGTCKWTIHNVTLPEE